MSLKKSLFLSFSLFLVCLTESIVPFCVELHVLTCGVGKRSANIESLDTKKNLVFFHQKKENCESFVAIVVSNFFLTKAKKYRLF